MHTCHRIKIRDKKSDEFYASKMLLIYVLTHAVALRKFRKSQLMWAR